MPISTSLDSDGLMSIRKGMLVEGAGNLLQQAAGHWQVQGVLCSMTQLFADLKLPLIYTSQAHTCLARSCLSGSGRELCASSHVLGVCPQEWAITNQALDFKQLKPPSTPLPPGSNPSTQSHTAPNPRVQLNELRRYTTGALQRSYQSSPITPFPSRPDDNLPQT
jgi:hypothetical protein